MRCSEPGHRTLVSTHPAGRARAEALAELGSLRMKFMAGILIAALVAGLLGCGVEKALALRRRNSSASAAGDTLTALSFALQLEKEKAGAYPDSILGLQVEGDPTFSDRIQRVVYRKTTNGYVAFLAYTGGVVYIEPGTTAQFK
jgi:hypothetical protein